MFRLGRMGTGLAALLCALLTIVVVGSSPALAVSGNPAYCDAAVEPLTNPNIQKEIPVIMVHGFAGKAKDWGFVDDPASFAGVVDQLPGVAVAHLFSYNSLLWVDNQDNGPKLAKTIDCVARLSLQNGGKGKVIVIGLSMGGLVARDALNRRSSDGQRAIRDEVGQVITIGTPHTGTNTATGLNTVLGTLLKAFLPGLPPFPSQTMVHTIAGDVVRVFYDQNGNEVKREQPHDDTLVPTSSANVAAHGDASRGGGSTTITCEKRYNGYGPFGWYLADRQAAPCEHNSLISNAGNGVREDTVGAIRKYVASLSARQMTVGSLTVAFDDRWTNIYSMMPGRDGSASDTTNGVPCTNCTTTPTPTSYAFMQLDYYGSWCSGPVQSCAVGSNLVIALAPAVVVGGRVSDYSVRYQDGGMGAGTSLVWCFTDRKVCVHYRRSANSPQLELSQAALDVFSTATWSN